MILIERREFDTLHRRRDVKSVHLGKDDISLSSYVIRRLLKKCTYETNSDSLPANKRGENESTNDVIHGDIGINAIHISFFYENVVKLSGMNIFQMKSSDRIGDKGQEGNENEDVPTLKVSAFSQFGKSRIIGGRRCKGTLRMQGNVDNRFQQLDEPRKKLP